MKRDVVENSIQNRDVLQKKDYTQIQAFVKKITSHCATIYLSKQYQEQGGKTKSDIYCYQLGNYYFDENDYENIKNEINIYEKKYEAFLCFCLYNNKTAEFIEENLLERNVPKEFSLMIIQTILDSEYKIGNELSIKEAQETSSLLDNQSIIIKVNSVELSEEEGISDPDGIIGSQIRSFICKTQKSMQQRPSEIPDTNYVNFDVHNLPNDFSIQTWHRIQEYKQAANLKKDRSREISLVDIESNFQQRATYWLFQMTDILCQIIDIHLVYHFKGINPTHINENLDKTEIIESKNLTLLDKIKLLYFKVLKKQQTEFYLIKNALINLNIEYPITKIDERRFFELIISDINVSFLNYLTEFSHYCSTITACATSIQREEVCNYINFLFQNITPYIIDHNSTQNVISILKERIEELDTIYIITSHQEIDQLNLLVKYNCNADDNDVMLRILLKDIKNKYIELYNIKKRLDQPVKAMTPRLNQKKQNQNQIKKSSNCARSSKNQKQKYQPPNKPKGLKQITYTPLSVYARNLTIPSPILEESDNQNEWIKVNNKRSQKNRDLLSSAYKKISQQNFEEAIPDFINVIESSKNKRSKNRDYNHALYGLARCYEEKGEYQNALNVLTVMSQEWKINFNYQVTFGRICLLLGHTHQAKSIFQNMSKRWNNNKVILQFLARCHQAIGEEAVAIKIFESLLEQSKDLSTIVNLAYSYSKIGKHLYALELLSKLSADEKKEKIVILAQVRFYKNIGKYKKALQLLAKCIKNEQYKDDKELSLNIIECLLKIGNFDCALSKLQAIKIESWNQDKKIILLYVSYYMETNQYVDALNYLKQIIKQLPTDRDILLLTVSCYRKLEDYHNGLEVCELLIHYHPFYLKGHLELISIKRHLPEFSQQDILLAYDNLIALPAFKDRSEIYYDACLYLLVVCKRYQEAEQHIQLTIDRFPFNTKLYVLFIQALHKQKSFSRAADEIHRAREAFPDNISLKIEEIVHWLLVGSIEKATKLKQKFIKQYKNNYKLCQSLERACNQTRIEKNIDQPLTHMKQSSEPTITDELPPLILAVFKQLKTVATKVVLTGSTAIRIVELTLAGSSLLDADLYRSDLDFSVLASREQLANIVGMTPSHFQKNLFIFKFTYEGQVHVIDVMLYQAEGDWLYSNAYRRDFTACSILIEEKDKHGIIYDMLGRSVCDIQNKILDTNSPYPTLVFELDPACLLRAIKYVLYNFNLTDRMNKAIALWRGCNVAPHYGHLRALTIRHLKENPETRVAYLQLLCLYGLLHKIFAAHWPTLLHPYLKPEDIDNVFANYFLRLLLEQGPELKATGFYNIPGNSSLDIQDLPSLIESIKLESETLNKEKELDRDKQYQTSLASAQASGITYFVSAQRATKEEDPPLEEGVSYDI